MTNDITQKQAELWKLGVDDNVGVAVFKSMANKEFKKEMSVEGTRAWAMKKMMEIVNGNLDNYTDEVCDKIKAAYN